MKINRQNTQSVFDGNVFQFTFGLHREKDVIWITFQYDAQLIGLLKQRLYIPMLQINLLQK